MSEYRATQALIDRQPSASGVTIPSASVDAVSWRATWPVRWRNTSSLPEKYW
jgi:hypothetical protein